MGRTLKRSPKVIDYSKDAEFLCMKKDAHLLYNLMEQKTRGYLKDTDYIQPGILSGQSLGDILRVTHESIGNHLKNFEKKGVILL